MDQMIALFMIAAVVVLAALAESFGSDTRDYEPRTALGENL